MAAARVTTVTMIVQFMATDGTEGAVNAFHQHW